MSIKDKFAEMKAYFHNKYKGLFSSWTDTARIALMAALAYFLFTQTPDLEATLKIVLYVFGFQVVMSLMSHISRKLLFPYIDIKQFVAKALEDPLASSVIVLSMSVLISTFVAVSAQFFK